MLCLKRGAQGGLHTGREACDGLSADPESESESDSKSSSESGSGQSSSESDNEDPDEDEEKGRSSERYEGSQPMTGGVQGLPRKGRTSLQPT